MGKKRACRRADTHPSRGRGGTEACAKKKVGDWAGAVGGGGWRRPGPARRIRFNRPLREKEDDGGSKSPPPHPYCRGKLPLVPTAQRREREKGEAAGNRRPRAIGGFFSLRPILVCRSGTGMFFFRDKAGIFRTAAVASAAAAAAAAAIPCLRKMRRKPLSRLPLSPSASTPSYTSQLYRREVLCYKYDVLSAVRRFCCSQE